jgi:DNA repair exonuclease SbcCD ATPase subunit
MHITFEKIKIKNFLTIGNYFINVNLCKNPLTLIYGKNGHGKSLILDAISFVLFNKPYRDINKPQLINSINKKELVVEISFTIKNDSFKIIRGMKPNIFEIYKNDVLLNQDADSRDYQKYLEDHIIHLNQKGFNQTVIMGSATFVPFMKLKTPERRLVIEDLLDLQIFTSMNIVLKQKIKDNEQVIENIQSNISQFKSKIQLQEQYNKKIEDDRAEGIVELEQRINNLQSENNNLHEQIQNNNNLIEQLSNNITDETKLRNKIKEIHEIKIGLNHRLNDIKSDIDFFSSSNYECPTCSQELSDEFKNNKLHICEADKDQIENGIEKLKIKQQKHQDKLQVIVDISNNINKITNDNKIAMRDISHNNKIISECYESIKKIHNKQNKEINIDVITELKNNKTELEIKLKELSLIGENYNIALSLLKDNGIKAQIIKTYIPVINKFINQYLKEMGFLINFQLDENFNETINSRDRDIFTYGSFSEGQKLRINLALIFTWRMISKMINSTTTNIIFFDEIMDSSLDQEGVDAFFRLLKTFESNSNVFIISHNIDADRFPHKINVTMAKNFSRWTEK